MSCFIVHFSAKSTISGVYFLTWTKALLDNIQCFKFSYALVITKLTPCISFVPSSKARGEKSFLLNKERIRKIEKVVRTQAQKFGVEIYRYANVGNHLHMLIKASYRKGFIAFLRTITGLIARIALDAEKGKAKLNDTSRFWDQRPWTRILSTWTEFKNVKKYVEQNFNEAMGFTPYKPRKYKSTA